MEFFHRPYLDISDDHRLVTLALESIDLWLIISYLLDDVEYEERLVTDGRLSLPTSTELSLENIEYLKITFRKSFVFAISVRRQI